MWDKKAIGGLKFKASMSLSANLTFRNGWILVSVGFPTLADLNSLFKEISKIIPWSRCPGALTSIKCEVNVDSLRACGFFIDREYRFLRIWWRPNRKLTIAKSPSNETSCIQCLLYFLEPWLRCRLFVLSHRFKTWTDWRLRPVRFPILSILLLQPYGANQWRNIYDYYCYILGLYFWSGVNCEVSCFWIRSDCFKRK